MEARLGITQWLIDHDLASVELKHDSDGKLVDAYARIDREKVLSNGQKVMGELLLNLQVLKSTGDEKGANGKSFLAPSLLPFPY
jgi:dipeptidyl-peptidase-3